MEDEVAGSVDFPVSCEVFVASGMEVCFLPRGDSRGREQFALATADESRALPLPNLTLYAGANELLLLAALTFLAHSPKGADPKIAEGETEAEGDQNARRALGSGLVFGILSRYGETTNQPHRKENKARYLKPKLVKNARERACRRP